MCTLDFLDHAYDVLTEKFPHLTVNLDQIRLNTGYAPCLKIYENGALVAIVRNPVALANLTRSITQ